MFRLQFRFFRKPAHRLGKHVLKFSKKNIFVILALVWAAARITPN